VCVCVWCVWCVCDAGGGHYTPRAGARGGGLNADSVVRVKTDSEGVCVGGASKWKGTPPFWGGLWKRSLFALPAVEQHTPPQP